MRFYSWSLLAACVGALPACSSSSAATPSASAGAGTSGSSAGAGASGASGSGGSSAGTAGGGGSAGASAPSASELLARVQACANELTITRYATDDGAADTVPVCQLNGALFWTADMDVDCDGLESGACNLTTDPWFQNQTSSQDSKGNWLDAATLPYFVIPSQSSARFAYDQHGVDLGSVAAIVYADKVEYAVFGDQGPDNIIGEASYATAQALGIDPDPATGGTDGPVTYIVFTGADARVAKMEDHAAAVSLGQARAARFLAENP